MGDKQREVGEATETLIAEWFRAHKYWAYILPKKIGGQPFDIIAARGGSTWFVDAKHLEASKKSFSFDRVESNQMTSMYYAKNMCNMKNVGFIIVQPEIDPNRLFYLSYDRFVEETQNGSKSVKLESLENMEEKLNENKNI